MSDSLHITFKEIIELCSDSEDSTVEIDSDDENDEKEEDDVVIVYDGPPLATSSQKKKSEEEEKEEHQEEDEKKKKPEAQPVVRRDLSPEEVAKCPPYITRSFVRGVEELASGNVQPSNVRRRQSDRLKNKQQAAVKESQKKASPEKRSKNQSKAVAKKPRKTDAEQSSTLTCPKCHDSYPTVKDLCDHYAVHVFKTDSSVQQQQQQHQQQPAPVPPPPSFDVFNFTEAIPQPERRYFCPQCPELNGFEQAIELEVHNELIHASPDDYLNLPPGTSSSTTSIAINRALLTAPSLNQPVTRPFEDATTVTEWSSSLLDDTNFPFGPPPPVFQPLIDPDWPCPPFDSLFNTSDSIFRI